METPSPFLSYAGPVLFAVAMAYGGLSDLLTFRIPDWTSIAGVAAYFVAAGAADWDATSMLSNGAAGLAALVVGFGLFAARLIGGGDAKLLAAAAVWFGWRGLPHLLLAVAVLGGVLAALILVFRRLALPARMESVAWIRDLHDRGRGIPYGIAISLSALALFQDHGATVTSGN